MIRLWSLIKKEFRQIGRNRRLVISLILPPTLQIVLFGLALNPEVKELRLGVIDESRTYHSRELISAFDNSGTFTVIANYRSTTEMEAAIISGEIKAGLVVPVDFAVKQLKGTATTVQLLLDATDANTATIAGAHAKAIVASLNPDKAIEAVFTPLYNPGLRYSWFIVPGILGILIILNGSIVSACALVKEREDGTIEQLLISPARTVEIVAAKFTPLMVLLTLQSWLGLAVGAYLFGLPVRGSILLLLAACSLCVLVSIGIGGALAALSRTQAQAQLLTIFVNPPIVMLSGTITPIEALPAWLQPLTLINPARHFAELARDLTLKGGATETAYLNLLALVVCATILLLASLKN